MVTKDNIIGAMGKIYSTIKYYKNNKGD